MQGLLSLVTILDGYLPSSVLDGGNFGVNAYVVSVGYISDGVE